MATVPDVPNAPGVPPLAWDGPPPDEPALQAPPSGGGASYPVPQAGPPPVWGIFDQSGAPVAVSESAVYSFAGMGLSKDARIPNYQIEQGAFGSYNKVQTPYQAPVRLVCGGDVQTRQAFLAAVDAAQQSLDLYSIVTPEVTKLNANITGYSLRRETEDGAYLLKVDLRVEEVRVVTAAYTTSTAEPSGASPVGSGKVQPQAPTAPQASTLQSGLDYFSSLASP